MKSVNKSIDINAHIEDISCEVILEKENTFAIISFVNLGYGDITAIKFNAIGYNSFGDIVPVENKNNFLLIIQDIRIAKNQKSENYKIKLPVSGIRKIDIEEVQICYSDETVLTYQGKNEMNIELEMYDDSDKELLEALNKMYNGQIKYRAKEFENGWICGCGRYNSKDLDACSLCGKEKEKIFEATSERNADEIIESYHEKMEKDKEADRLKAINDEKIRRRFMKVGIVVAIVGVISGIAGNSYILSKRETYASVEDMQEALKGKWSYKGVSGDVLWQLEIGGDTAIKRFDADDMGFFAEINWNPARGTFKCGGDEFVVEKGGEVIREGKYIIYNKGGNLTSSKKVENSYKVDNPYKDLKITIDTVSSNSSYDYCTGSVKNNGNRTYKFVKVKGTFRDESDNVIDTDWTYVVGDEGLAENESSTFRLSVPRNFKIRSCRVELLDWN